MMSSRNYNSSLLMAMSPPNRPPNPYRQPPNHPRPANHLQPPSRRQSPNPRLLAHPPISPPLRLILRPRRGWAKLALGLLRLVVLGVASQFAFPPRDLTVGCLVRLRHRASRSRAVSSVSRRRAGQTQGPRQRHRYPAAASPAGLVAGIHPLQPPGPQLDASGRPQPTCCRDSPLPGQQGRRRGHGRQLRLRRGAVRRRK